MRDFYAEADLQSDTMKEAVVASSSGMRHSIRPRRDALTDRYTPAAAPVAAPRAPAKALPEQIRAPLGGAVDVEPLEEQPLAAPPVVTKTYYPDPELPHWHDLERVEAGTDRSGETALPVVDAARDSASVRAFDLLRTRLRQTTQEHGWTNIAITTPTSGCGNTFTAVNLALSLSRIKGSRTVLMDFNLRRPGIAQAFDMTPPGAMRDMLMGQSPIGDHMVKVSDTLALGLNNTPDTEASETLQASETAHTMERMRAALQPELVIYDMPAMLTHDDVSAFLPQLDGVLLVSDGTQTMGRELMECERMLDGQVPLLGVVLNRARANSIPRYS